MAQGPDGTREIAIDDFFTGFLESALTETEIVTEIKVPKVPDATWSFQKFNRRAQDWAIVGASVLVDNGSCGVGLVNMARCRYAPPRSRRPCAGGANAADAAALAAEGASPSADLSATVEYREHLARVLVRRGLEAAGR